ncbi:unnamed protein product [Rotaria sp. Silwood1]|nr:unnamed protein product [Rotaria sp. Silwood1]
MGKVEKKSVSLFSTHGLSTKSKALIQTGKQINEINNENKKVEHSDINTNTNILIKKSDESENDEDWETVGYKKASKIQKRKATTTSTTDTQQQQITYSDVTTEGVHSYFSFGKAETKLKPLSTKKNFQGLRRTQAQYQTNSSLNNNINARNNQLHLPPFKIEFENQQKPPEIQVLNDLVKQNHKLNISTAFYSKYIQSHNVLLLFANDSSTYEMLFENSSWPNLICNLSFKVTLPRRIPVSYSVIVNRIPREWNVDTIHPLIAERYTSTDRVTRIFRDDQPTTKVRIDFHSQDDVNLILKNGYIYIDSIRYTATTYKPLTQIDRCFKCQQFGHKIHNCMNEPKYYKCGEIHTYNPNCLNPIKCANCAGSHIAGAPQCPAKISYRKNQQQQQTTSMISKSTATPYLPSSARLYSTVLQTMSSHVNSNTQSTALPEPSKFEQTDQSSVIIKTLKDEITKSHDILIDKILHIEQKSDLAMQQHLSSLQMIETQIVPYLFSMSELLVNVYDKLSEKKIIQATDQQKTKLSFLRALSTTRKKSSISHFTSNTSISSPLLIRTQAQSNLCSLTTPTCNQPQSTSLSQLSLESNLNKNLFLQNDYFQ